MSKVKKQSLIAQEPLIILLSTPLIAGVLLVSVLPTILGALTSLTDLELSYVIQWNFVGLENFGRALSDSRFLESFRIGAIWALSVTVLAMILGFTLALLIERRKYYSPILKILAVFPWALSPVIIAIIWDMLLNPNSGPITGYLRKYELPGANVSLLYNLNTALPTVIVIGAWLSLPVVTISFLAALKTIPREMIEAALIDGTSASQRMRLLIIPQLRPIITALVALNIIWNFNSFGLIFVLTNGGPGGRTYLPGLFVYEESFRYGNFGYAAALGMIITIALVIILGIYVATRNRNEVEA
ncbi:MAG: sugar ABC transporter permease [Acidobacteria bacterium]|jgi:multiple sugar transport system permease protein|nr:sugar ABC transporter permease [Acidobacteriota bacterium]